MRTASGENVGRCTVCNVCNVGGEGGAPWAEVIFCWRGWGSSPLPPRSRAPPRCFRRYKRYRRYRTPPRCFRPLDHVIASSLHHFITSLLPTTRCSRRLRRSRPALVRVAAALKDVLHVIRFDPKNEKALARKKVYEEAMQWK